MPIQLQNDLIIIDEYLNVGIVKGMDCVATPINYKQSCF